MIRWSKLKVATPLSPNEITSVVEPVAGPSARLIFPKLALLEPLARTVVSEMLIKPLVIVPPVAQDTKQELSFLMALDAGSPGAG
ncbi:hypothetical protein D3C86_1306810 [compost metagenome]